MTLVDKLLKKIEENRFKNYATVCELCESLYNEADKVDDDHLRGLALYYKGETLFFSDAEAGSDFLVESHKHFVKERDPELYARLNNFMGIIYSNKDYYTLSLDYYLECLRVCDDYKFDYIGALACCNIGVIFQLIESYDLSLDYFKRGLNLLDNVEQSPGIQGLTASIYTNFFICYYKLNDLDNLKDILDKIWAVKEDVNPVFTIKLFQAIYDGLVGDNENVESLLADSVEESYGEEDYGGLVDAYQLLCEILLQHKLYDLLGRVLKAIDEKMPDTVFPRPRMNFAKYGMDYYKEIKDYEMFVKKAEEYVALYKKTEEIQHAVTLDSIKMKFYIDELKQTGELYKKEAQSDALTGLYNRNGLEDLGVQMLEEAKESDSPVFAFIIDIDYFKQYNDYYGHIKGDQCLKKVAEVIKSKCTKYSMAARYGGDEFVLAGQKITHQDYDRIAKEIVEDVAALKIESVDSPISDYVTVSVGGFAAIPDDENTAKELIAIADKALYAAKKKGRNCYVIYE